MRMMQLKKELNRFIKKKAVGDDTVRRHLIQCADEARDQKQFIIAAKFYEQSLRFGTPRTDILLQCGHMYKEAKNFPPARVCYLQALDLEPNNAEILLQLGHFSKVVGHYIDAEDYYKKATVALPEWDVPRSELIHLQGSIDLEQEKQRTSSPNQIQPFDDDDSIDILADNSLINSSLFPKTREELYINHQEAFVFTRNGNYQKTRWGDGPTVRGIDALRGYIVSPIPYLYIEIFLGGELVYRSNLVVAPQRREKSNLNIRKYAYNAWIDFSKFPCGWHDLVFRATNVRGDMREGTDWRRERIIIAETMLMDAFPDCDGVIPPLDETSGLSVVAQVNARPSIIHRATTRSFPGTIRNVAVIRADQLGDMVVSIPALQRLRQMLPDARLVGLLSKANEGLARSLKIFDEIVLLDFPDDPNQRQRTMDREGQKRLMRQLAPYKFDLAIDFPVQGVSHKLLPLTGAPVTMGYGGDGRKILDLSLSTHDPKTNNDIMRHSARTRVLMEALALWLDSGAQTIRRDDLNRETLYQYGVGVDEDFIVLHSGSRIKFTRWPHYAELAQRIVQELGKQVVFMADNDAQEAELPSEALASGRIIFLNQSLSFDHFDTFLSFCHVFVGNDSGPKHLASLRGAKVISIHSSRIAWNEWGQEHTGVVISRQVPCAGCSLHHDPEECAQDVACIKKITVEEVFREIVELAS